MENGSTPPSPVDCTFCAIVARKAPAAVIYEDQHTLAFLDIRPANPGHALVIPKRHARDLLDVDPADLTHVMNTVQRIVRAIDVALQPDGINLIQANRSAAFQSVFHFHVHVIPRWESDGLKPIWRHGRATEAELREMAGRIRGVAKQ